MPRQLPQSPAGRFLNLPICVLLLFTAMPLAASIRLDIEPYDFGVMIEPNGFGMVIEPDGYGMMIEPSGFASEHLAATTGIAAIGLGQPEAIELKIAPHALGRSIGMEIVPIGLSTLLAIGIQIDPHGMDPHGGQYD